MFPKSGLFTFKAERYVSFNQIFPVMAKRSLAAIERRLDSRLKKKQKAAEKRRAREAQKKRIEAKRKKLNGY